jgi:ankyrin repeat protein
MMSVFLTQELAKHTAGIYESELIYLFCSAEDDKRNTGVALLRGLIHQIIDKRPQLVKHAQPFLETPEKRESTLSSLETLWIIFSQLITDSALGAMFCVLDGLDECDESSLRVLLQRVVNLLIPKNSLVAEMFKLVVVSRDIHALQGCNCSRIRLDPDNDAKVDSDIELFVSTRVQELSGIEGFNEDFQSYVQAALLYRSEGTFLWVGFAMHELSQKETCSEILEILEDLPTGLPAIYNRMLLRIPARHREVSQAILRWVTMAVRPLELEELAAAVGLQPRHSHFTTGQVARDAVTRCGPLLKIQEQSVSLVHQSMRDYLLREERDNDTVLDAFRVRKESSHLELAQKCLDCLARSSLQHKVIGSKAEIDSQDSPLLNYATFNWPEHAKNCSALAAKLIDPYGFFLQKTSLLRQNWWNSYKKEFSFVPGYHPLLHIACGLDIIPWVEALLSKRTWMSRFRNCVNEKSKSGVTALWHAAHVEDIALVQLLLDRGADIKAENNNGTTALHIAAEKENRAVAQLLLDRGADVDAKRRSGETALHIAAKYGSKTVAQLLLDRGTDFNAKTRSRETALHAAAKYGSEIVAQLLLDRGADVDVKNESRETALHVAAEQGSETVVQQLLNKGADIEAKNYQEKTSLHIAVGKKNTAVVQLLLDRGADINAKNRLDSTALHQAAAYGSEIAVQLLLDKGANIMARQYDGGTPLHSAAVFGHRIVVELLLDRGADIKAKDKVGQTALHLSAGTAKEDVVHLLENRGADVNAKNAFGNTALQWAMEKKSELLLPWEEGPDPAKRRAIIDFLRSRMEPSEI